MESKRESVNSLGNNKKIGKFIGNNAIYLFLIILFIVSAAAAYDKFLTALNLSNLIRQYTHYIFIALGMLMVILTGGIDLSIGAIIAFTNCVGAMLLMKYHWSTFPMILGVLGLGSLSGFISGYLVSYRKMAPFIVTLAMMSINKSLAYMFTNARVIDYKSDFLKTLGGGSFLNIGGFELPNQLLVLIPVIVIMYLMMSRTSYGRLIYAIGSNENAAVLSGINTKVIKTSVYVMSGFLAALSAIFILSRLNAATASTGQSLEMDAIAACVIGGASLAGGKGSVMKTVAGVFVLALIGNIMNLLAIPSYPQDAIKGLIIILAVLFQR